MAGRVLDRVIADAQANEARTAGNVTPMGGQPRAAGRGQVFDGEGNRVVSGQYAQKRYDAAGRELPESRGWINIGYWKMLPDAQGNMVRRFINLALGIPVDSIPKYKAAPGNKLRQEQNHLRELMVDKLDSMESGGEVELHLTVIMRRVFDQSEAEVQSDDVGPGFDLFSSVQPDESVYGEAEVDNDD